MRDSSSEEVSERFGCFLADEGPAVDQLRAFVGGEAGMALDCSLDSLITLDSFIANLTDDLNWESGLTELGGLERPRRWLTVRVAYYLGAVLRSLGASAWYLSSGSPEGLGPQPVVAAGGLEVSPLEVAAACLRGELDGGLYKVVADFFSAVGERVAHDA